MEEKKEEYKNMKMRKNIEKGKNKECRYKDSNKRHVIRIGLLAVAFIFLLAGCGKGDKEKKNLTGISSQEETQSLSGTAISGSVMQEKVETVEDVKDLSSRLAEQIASGIASQTILYMTPEFAGQMDEERMMKSFRGETEGISGYRGVEAVVEEEGENDKKVTVTLRYSNNEGVDIKFTFNKEKKITAMWFARRTLEKAEETALLDYVETDMSVGREPYVLEGVLTVPSVKEKPPVVLILSGDEESDKDGTIGSAGNKPFRDIAQAMATKGVASLRYNRRKQQYGKQVSGMSGTYDTLLEDAYHAINDLYNRKEIDREKIFVLAEGKAADALADLVREKEKRIAGVLIVGAGPSLRIEKNYTDTKKSVTSDAKYFMEKNSTLPMFLVRGKEDFETSAEEFKMWRTIMKGRAHTEYREFEKLNHFLIKSNNKKDATDYDVEGKVSVEASASMAEWILKQAI